MDLTKHKKQIFNWYHELPPWAKGVTIVGLLGVTVYAAHAITKSVRDRKNKAKSQSDVIGYVNDLDDLANQGIVPTFQQSQYQIWAASIVEQFAGCDASSPSDPPWGSYSYSNSGQKVFSIISQFKNNADFLALQAAFGIKSYDQCGIWTGDVTDVTLSGAISDELTNGEISHLNATLAAKGITYRF